MNRSRLITLAVACLIFTGCVEGEVVYTVNPDGAAKVQFDVVTVKPVDFNLDPGMKKDEEKSLDELLRESLKPMLQSPGVAAWKDVSAEFLPNGKIRISATAYVKKLE